MRYVIKDPQTFLALFAERGYKTKAAIARRLRISVNTVSRWLCGAGVSRSWAHAICSGLRVEISDLYEELDYKTYLERRKAT